MTYTWKVHQENLSEVTFEDFADDLAHIYKKVNARRDVFDMVLNTVRRTSKVAEKVRRQQHGRLALGLTDSVLWLLTLWAKIEGPPTTARDQYFRTSHTISDAIWMKYPDRCPVCFGGFAEDPLFRNAITALSKLSTRQDGEHFDLEPFRQVVNSLGPTLKKKQYASCRCLSISWVETRTEADVGSHDAAGDRKRKKANDNAKKAFRRVFAEYNRERRPSSVQDFEAMFRRIYGTAVSHFSLEDVSNHLQEEIGEVAGALVDCYAYRGRAPTEVEAKNTHLELAEEMADTISWSLSCLFKIGGTFDTLREYGMVLGRDKSHIMKGPTLSSMIWSQWSDHQLGHLICKECRVSEFCECGWTLKILH